MSVRFNRPGSPKSMTMSSARKHSAIMSESKRSNLSPKHPGIIDQIASHVAQNYLHAILQLTELLPHVDSHEIDDDSTKFPENGTRHISETYLDKDYPRAKPTVAVVNESCLRLYMKQISVWLELTWECDADSGNLISRKNISALFRSFLDCAGLARRRHFAACSDSVDYTCYA